MLKEYGLSPLADEALRITLTESLYECGVDENRIVEQLCKHCQCTLEEAIQHVVYEKTTRTPIRALQNYLEREKGFPADSRKTRLRSRLLQDEHAAGDQGRKPGGILPALRHRIRSAEEGQILPGYENGNGSGRRDGDMKEPRTGITHGGRYQQNRPPIPLLCFQELIIYTYYKNDVHS